MVIGAGDAANILIREMINSSYLDGRVVCTMDDDKLQIGKYIQGIKLVGNRNTIFIVPGFVLIVVVFVVFDISGIESWVTLQGFFFALLQELLICFSIT